MNPRPVLEYWVTFFCGNDGWGCCGISFAA